MKNVEFKNAVSSLSSACWTVFLELHAQGKPLPEGVQIKGNGTGYFDPMTEAFQSHEAEKNTIYSAVCPDTGRRMVLVPIDSFFGLSRELGRVRHDRNDCLVFFERYTEGEGPSVLIEQLTQYNNEDTAKVLKIANIIFAVGDFLV